MILDFELKRFEHILKERNFYESKAKELLQKLNSCYTMYIETSSANLDELIELTSEVDKFSGAIPFSLELMVEAYYCKTRKQQCEFFSKMHDKFKTIKN